MKTEATGEKPAIALAFRSFLQSGGPRMLEVRSGLNVANPAESLGSSDLSKLLFFGSARQLSATLGGIHPNLPKGMIHGSTTDGLRSLISHLDLGTARDVPHLASETIEGSAAILGGPVANLHARLVLGCGGASPLFGVQLPIEFDCSGASCETDSDEPWQVVVDGRTSQNECLVLTSLPMDRGSERLTIFSGLRGAGTRAIDLLLKDAHLIERLYRDTRNLLAWQAIIEVRARDTQFAESLGLYRVFEISNINFDDARNVVRPNLMLNDDRILELVRLLPPKDEIDFSDVTATGIANLHSYKLQKLLRRGTVSRVSKSLSSTNDPGRLTRQPGDRLAPEPLHHEEVEMNLTSDKRGSREIKQMRRQQGRPPKVKSDASLTRRLQILLSDRDIEAIEAIMEASGVTSMGQVIRDAVHKEFERLAAKKSKA